MHLGLFTAAFPDASLEEVADFAAANGFEALELAAWPQGDGAERRYAGVCHVPTETLDEAGAQAIRGLLDARGLAISSLGFYPNVFDPDPAAAEAARAHLPRVFRAAALLGVDVVGTFVGRDPSKPVPAAFADVEAVWPGLIAKAREHGVKVAFENCPMIFSHDEWPGGKNLAYSPAIWRRLFEILPGDDVGLNLDPSHLVWQMIDIEEVVREFAPKILHVHAKDLEVDRHGLYDEGVMSLGMGWQVPRLPGLGEVRWDRFVAALFRHGYDGVVSVEHEDRSFEGSRELVERGFLIARDALRPYLH
ncbi:MAG: sugar phosphate isomerase/epimerase family protein [Actinomycetota bacterium]